MPNKTVNEDILNTYFADGTTEIDDRGNILLIFGDYWIGME